MTYQVHTKKQKSFLAAQLNPGTPSTLSTTESAFSYTADGDVTVWKLQDRLQLTRLAAVSSQDRTSATGGAASAAETRNTDAAAFGEAARVESGDKNGDSFMSSNDAPLASSLREKLRGWWKPNEAFNMVRSGTDGFGKVK